MNYKSFVLGLRSVVFYVGYSLSASWFGITAVLLWWLPFPVRYRYIQTWNRMIVVWAKWSCGINYRVIGRENITGEVFVVLSKHQSPWETFYLQCLFNPLSTILKRELLSIPGFGWGLRAIEPIAIDRGSPREALRQTLAQGKERLAAGRSVLVFPEGTRISPGEVGNYARGGANLAIQGGVSVLPIAHNAGHCWPSHQFIKHPGTITVVIGPAISTKDRDARSVTEEAKTWIEGQMATLNNE